MCRPRCSYIGYKSGRPMALTCIRGPCKETQPQMFGIAYKGTAFYPDSDSSYLMAAGFTRKSVNDFSKWLQKEGFNEIRKNFEG